MRDELEAEMKRLRGEHEEERRKMKSQMEELELRYKAQEGEASRRVEIAVEEARREAMAEARVALLAEGRDGREGKGGDGRGKDEQVGRGTGVEGIDNPVDAALELGESQYAAWSKEAADDVRKRRELAAALARVRRITHLSSLHTPLTSQASFLTR